MPPKKGGNKVNAKNEKAKKEKIIEDKTFGLKNKKGGKAQKVKNRNLWDSNNDEIEKKVLVYRKYQQTGDDGRSGEQLGS